MVFMGSSRLGFAFGAGLPVGALGCSRDWGEGRLQTNVATGVTRAAQKGAQGVGGGDLLSSWELGGSLLEWADPSWGLRDRCSSPRPAPVSTEAPVKYPRPGAYL